MKCVNNIENKFGNFVSENVFQIAISSMKCEDELERQLDMFYSEEKYKLCVINIKPNEGKFLDYLKSFIDNKEKDFDLENKGKENKSIKIYIFIVHMVRIFNNQLKNLEKKSKKEQIEINNKILYRTLSNLSGYTQTFIDNLFGKEELAINNLIGMKVEDLYSKSLDLDRELLDNFYNGISYINYDIISSVYELNKDNYINHLIKFIRRNAAIRQLINRCIIRQIKKEEDPFLDWFK